MVLEGFSYEMHNLLGEYWWGAIMLFALVVIGLALLVYQRKLADKLAADNPELAMSDSGGRLRVGGNPPKSFGDVGRYRSEVLTHDEEKKFNRNIDSHIREEEEAHLDKIIRNLIPSETVDKMNKRIDVLEAEIHKLREKEKEAVVEALENEEKHAEEDEAYRTAIKKVVTPKLSKIKKVNLTAGKCTPAERVAAAKYFGEDHNKKPILINLPKAQDYQKGFEITIINKDGDRHTFAVSGTTRGPWRMVTKIKTTAEEWQEIHKLMGV